MTGDETLSGALPASAVDSGRVRVQLRGSVGTEDGHLGVPAAVEVARPPRRARRVKMLSAKF